MKYGNGNQYAFWSQSKIDMILVDISGYLSLKIINSLLTQFIFRYCEGGELFYFIVQRKSLNEKEAALIMKQSFSALKYLHENKISHR